MKSIQNHIYSIQKTFETLSKGKLLLFFLPGLIAGIVFFSIIGVAEGVRDEASGVKDWWLVGGFLGSAVDWIINLFNAVIIFILQFVLLTLLSPFNSALSEKFETEITGKEFKSSIVQFLNDMLRAIFIAILAILMEIASILLVFMFSWAIPDILENVLYFLIAAFFFGLAFYDYSLERHGVTTIGSIGFAFSHMGHVLLTGSIFSAIFAIPYIGMILAPVLATLIATGAYVKLKMPPATTETDTNS